MAALLGAALALAASPTPAAHAAESDPTLRELGQAAGLEIGAAINTDVLGTDQQHRELAASQFSSLTPENGESTTTAPPRRTTRSCEETPWSGTARSRPGSPRATEEDGSLRDSLWLESQGKDYIADSFRLAHQYDPDATLYCNDYNTEGINPKSDALYELVKELLADGVPIQGIGMQAHRDIQYPYPRDLQENMQRFADLGLDVAVTEADVRMDLPADATKLQAQAGAFDALLSSCLLVDRCVSFTTGGISDQCSWIPGVFEGQGAALLWDEAYQTKPAHGSLQRILALSAGDRSSGAVR